MRIWKQNDDASFRTGGGYEMLRFRQTVNSKVFFTVPTLTDVY